MKKKKFKLDLKKEAISNLQAKHIVGGRNRIIAAATDICGSGPGGTCIDDQGGNCNSANGCTGGPDETMTCPDWSCAC